MPASAAPRRRLVAFLVASSCFLFATPATRAQPAADKPTAHASLPTLPASSTVLSVTTKLQANGPTGGLIDADADLQRRTLTHAVTLASEHNLRRLFTQGDNPVRRTQWFKSTDDTVERAAWLRDHLRVRAIPGTSLIEVALPDVKDPNERKLILEEICTVYMTSHARAQGDQLSDRTAMLNGVRMKAESRLNQIRQEMQEKQVQLNINGGGISRVGVKEMEISALVGELIKAQRKAGVAQWNLESAQATIKEGRFPGDVDDRAWKLAPPNLMNDQQTVKSAEIRAALLKDQVGPNDPTYTRAAREAELLRASFDKAFDALRTKAKATYLDELKAEHAAARATADSLNERVKTLKADLGDLSNAMLNFLNLQEEEKALTAQVRQVREQIEKVVSVISSASSLDVSWHLHPEATPLPPTMPPNPAH